MWTDLNLKTDLKHKLDAFFTRRYNHEKVTSIQGLNFQIFYIGFPSVEQLAIFFYTSNTYFKKHDQRKHFKTIFNAGKPHKADNKLSFHYNQIHIKFTGEKKNLFQESE